MLWIPRPRENGLHMQDELAGQGVKSVCLPLIDIEYLDPPEQNILKTCQQLCFFSRYAVRALANAKLNDFPQQTIFAIGPGTAAELMAANIHVDTIVPAPHTSEAFIAHLDDFSSSGTTGFIIGEGGRKLILNEFHRRALPAIEIPVYRRTMPPLDEKTVLEFLRQHGVTAVLLTSLSILTHLLSLGDELKSALSKTAFLVNSERIAEACRQAGFLNIIISERASNDAIMDSILLYFRE